MEYSEISHDAVYEYRHVHLPQSVSEGLTGFLMSEDEWRRLGVRMSPGWEHYAYHNPEPHILLFRRLLVHTHATDNRRAWLAYYDK
jgi:cyclin-dependent kinase regulatory subunit CKS1